MPLREAGDFGTNADGSPSTEYCVYCYKDGAFTADCTMDEMIEHCLQYLNEFNKDSGQTFTVEEARAQMHLYFPQLKRWKTGE